MEINPHEKYKEHQDRKEKVKVFIVSHEPVIKLQRFLVAPVQEAEKAHCHLGESAVQPEAIDEKQSSPYCKKKNFWTILILNAVLLTVKEQ